jgi:hypothetical protein
MKLFSLAIAALPLFGAQAVTSTAPNRAGQTTTRPAPKPVNDILAVQPFTLQQGFRNTWSKERALVSSGVVIVVAVDPALARRRDAAEPILYAGDTAVQRLNDGGQSGRIIAIVPGAASLANAPIWFGAPGLPERVTADTARAERAQAEKSGIRPFAAEKLRGITRPAVAAANQAALLRDHVAPLLLEYSPQEKELADSWRLPSATGRPK